MHQSKHNMVDVHYQFTIWNFEGCTITETSVKHKFRTSAIVLIIMINSHSKSKECSTGRLKYPSELYQDTTYCCCLHVKYCGALYVKLFAALPLRV